MSILAGLVGIAALLSPVQAAPGQTLSRRANVTGTTPLPLKFREDGEFQLSIFEDLHFGENAWDDWGPVQDINSVKVINTVLDNEFPDLVVLNGDLITGNNAFLENSTIYVDMIVKPLLERNLTWASTYGNHDSDYNLSRTDLLAKEQTYASARTVSMVDNENAGKSNFYLPVYGRECDVTVGADAAAEACVPVMILWFFDSRGGKMFQELDANGNQVNQPDWVDTSVVDWFKTTHAALTAKYAPAGKKTPYVLPSLAFVHIPTYASLALQTESGKGIDEHKQPGINDDYPLAPQAQSWCADGTYGCSYGGQDKAFMEAIVAAGDSTSIIAVFSGHDHGDTWCYKWDHEVANIDGKGVNLCFGQHSGHGGYGSWTRGARQVLVKEDDIKRATGSSKCQARRPDVNTWIRLETGDVVGAVTLNSTYGTDEYPATPDTYS